MKYVLLFKKNIMFNNAINMFSYKDIKTREVDDRIWVFFIPIGIIITFNNYNYCFNNNLLFKICRRSRFKSINNISRIFV